MTAAAPVMVRLPDAFTPDVARASAATPTCCCCCCCCAVSTVGTLVALPAGLLGDLHAAEQQQVDRPPLLRHGLLRLAVGLLAFAVEFFVAPFLVLSWRFAGQTALMVAVIVYFGLALLCGYAVWRYYKLREMS